MASILFRPSYEDEVGITVPVAEVRQLLSRLMFFSTAGTKIHLSGTELVQKVVKYSGTSESEKRRLGPSIDSVFGSGQTTEKAPQTKLPAWISAANSSIASLKSIRFPETAIGKFRHDHFGEKITDYREHRFIFAAKRDSESWCLKC